MAKSITLNYTDELLNSEGRSSKSGKSALKAFDNVYMFVTMADNTIHRFRLQASLYDEGEHIEKSEEEKVPLKKAEIAVG